MMIHWIGKEASLPFFFFGFDNSIIFGEDSARKINLSPQ